MRRIRWAWRWLVVHLGPPRCRSCGKPLRRLVEEDLTPEVVRTRRLAGTLGGLLDAGHVCDRCTAPGHWILIE
jgi:hypothetical protein